MNIINGFHAITAYIDNNLSAIQIIYVDKDRHDKRMQHFLELCNAKDICIQYKNSAELDAISRHATHQGVIAISNASIQQYDLTSMINKCKHKNNSIFLALDGITDVHNLGAIIRTADCFGVDAILLPLNNSANINNQHVIKSSSGAIYNMPIIQVKNLVATLNTLQNNNYWIVGTTLHDKSISLFEFKFEGNIVLVMGNENHGMRHLVTETCDYLLTIPMLGKTQSLNVSVTTGVILSHLITTYKL